MLSENEIKQLLISKGVAVTYIHSLKRRNVALMNARLYELDDQEFEYVDIPVSKIISTHRIGSSGKSWWKSIFDKINHNVSQTKWQQIQDIFSKQSIQEFQKSLYSVAPPIESATYYPEYDVYTVNEGHHRTVWAILTGTPFLKVRRLSLSRFSPTAYEKRKKFFKDAVDIKRKTKELLIKVDQLIDSQGFSVEDDWISFRGKKLFLYETASDKDLSPISSVQSWYLNAYSDVFSTLEFSYKEMNQLLSLHHKYKYIPRRLRTKVLHIQGVFGSNDVIETLCYLYENNWPILKK